jgi:hypothetical protein
MIASFGESQHERVEIDVLRYERSPVGEYYDDNWLTVKIQVAAGGFRGTVDAAILTDELTRFLTQLRPVYENLRGTAEFTTLEEQLRLTLSGDGKGHIELIGQLADQPGIGNRLHFTLRFDQSQLAESIRQLAAVTSQFPVRTIDRA